MYYCEVNTRYSEKKKKHKLFFFDENDDPNRNTCFDPKCVSFRIRRIDFNLVFTSYKSSLFSGGLGVQAL